MRKSLNKIFELILIFCNGRFLHNYHICPGYLIEEVYILIHLEQYTRTGTNF